MPLLSLRLTSRPRASARGTWPHFPAGYCPGGDGSRRSGVTEPATPSSQCTDGDAPGRDTGVPAPPRAVHPHRPESVACGQRRPAQRRPGESISGGVVSMNQQQYEKVRSGQGFIAALDQSGGSTPKALKLYGIERGRLLGRRRDVRPDARDAHAGSSPARLQRRPRSSARSCSRRRWTARSRAAAPPTTSGT